MFNSTSAIRKSPAIYRPYSEESKRGKDCYQKEMEGLAALSRIQGLCQKLEREWQSQTSVILLGPTAEIGFKYDYNKYVLVNASYVTDEDRKSKLFDMLRAKTNRSEVEGTISYQNSLYKVEMNTNYIIVSPTIGEEKRLAWSQDRVSFFDICLAGDTLVVAMKDNNDQMLYMYIYNLSDLCANKNDTIDLNYDTSAWTSTSIGKSFCGGGAVDNCRDRGPDSVCGRCHKIFLKTLKTEKETSDSEKKEESGSEAAKRVFNIVLSQDGFCLYIGCEKNDKQILQEWLFKETEVIRRAYRSIGIDL